MTKRFLYGIDRGLFVNLIVVCFFSLSTTSVTARDNRCCNFSASERPIWQSVLDVPIGGPGDECAWSDGNTPGTVAYSDKEHIVVAIHLQCALSPSAAEIPAHTLDILFTLDATDGKVLSRTEWKDISIHANRAGNLEILPTYDGSFLLMVGPFLKKFSRALKEERSRVLIAEPIGPEEYWVVHVTPDGRTGFFKHWNRYSKSQDDWFSVDTLEDEVVETAPPEETWRSVVAENALYFRPLHPPPQSPREPTYVRERGQAMGRPLCSKCDGFPVAIVPHDLLLMENGPNASFTLASADGEIIHSVAYGAGPDAISRVAVAARAPRFAVQFGHVQKRLLSWESSDRVVVFDTSKMTDVLQIKLRQEPKQLLGAKSWMGEAIALSPDGTRIAILSGAVLKLFGVPQP